MSRSTVSRSWFVGAILTAVFLTIAITAWLLLPQWRQYRAVQAVVSAAKKSDVDGVLDGINRLAKLGITASSEDAIFACLNHPDANVRCYSAISAVSLDLDRGRAKAAFFKMINEDEDERVRNTAIACLGGLGADAADAVPAITEELLKDPRDPRDHRAPRPTVLALLDIQFAGVELPDPSLVPASPPMWFWVPPSPSDRQNTARRLIAHSFLTPPMPSRPARLPQKKTTTNQIAPD
jgi:hypothetical protein